MKIRDLRRYIADRCDIDEPDLSLLGDSEEPFLVNLWGKDKAVESLIEESASFAQHSEEQLFYEFVQNAFDANATDLFFYVNENYLIVLNNGDPFYTDRKIKGEEQRDGQLYSFLAKNKSDKFKKKDKLGNYGQGSKLLYTLLIDDSAGHNNEALIKAIRDEKKGPYLISWADSTQLHNFLLDRYEWEYESPYDDWNNLLVAKIILSYYPVMPGTDGLLFSENDYHDIVKAFNDLVDPKRNVNKLQQGTALIIPLGQGQYKKINSLKNRERVLARLGIFASIQKDKPQNVTKKLQHIYVFNEESRLYPVVSIFHHTKIKDEDFDFHFAFHPIFAQDNCVNFFKALPILDTKYHLGFIIDSQDWETDPSRQRLLFLSKVADQLSYVFPEILQKILKIKKESPDVFYTIYSSILSSSILVDDNEEIEDLRNKFKDVFLPFLTQNVLTLSGNYLPIGKVRSSTTYTIFNLKELGITEFEWTNKEVADLYENNIGVHISKGTIKEVVRLADPYKMRSWIKRLSSDMYQKFHKACCQELWGTIDYSDLKVYRSNKGNLFSKSEILSDSNVFFCYGMIKKDVFEACEDIEYIEHPLTNTMQVDDYLTCLFDKIKNNQHYFASSDAAKEIAGTIIAAYLNNLPSKVDDARKLTIFRNYLGQLTPCEDLFMKRPEDTVLYDNYLVKGYIPKSMPSECFVDNSNLWSWVVSHFDDIVQYHDWTEFGSEYIKDIKSAYNENLRNNNSYGTQTLNLYLDDNGVPTQTVQYKLNNSTKLSEQDYCLLVQAFPNASLCSYKNLKLLTTAPFQLPEIHIDDLINFKRCYSEDEVRCFFKVNKDILDSWTISQEEDGFRFRTKGDPKHNYIPNGLDTSVMNCLRRGQYYPIPEDIVPFISPSKYDAYNPYNVDFLDNALEICPRVEDLLPLIETSEQRIKMKYLSKVSLDFNNQQFDESDIRWSILMFGVNNPPLKAYLFSRITFNGSPLPPTIKASEMNYHRHVYNVYDLSHDIAKANANIEKFLGLLPDRRAFRDYYYAGKQDSATPQELFVGLDTNALSVVQLQFCLDYATENTIVPNSLYLASNDDLEDAMDMIYREKFKLFDRYFHIDGFDKSCQVFAESKYLTSNECLPVGLYNWIAKTEGAFGFIDNLTTSSHPLIKARMAIYDNQEFKIKPKDYDNLTPILHNTVLWICSLNREYQYGQPSFVTIMDILNSLVDGYTNIPMFAFNGNLGKSHPESDVIVPLLELKCPASNSYFVRHDRCHQFCDLMVKSSNFRNFVSRSASYFLTPSLDFLTRHRFDRKRVITTEKAANDSSNYVEWDDSIYLEWKKSTKCRILLCPDKISSSFKVSTKYDVLYTEPRDMSDYGYIYKQCVIIRYPNQRGKSVMKHLELAVADNDLEWFVQSFVTLQSMFLDQLEQLQYLAKSQGTSIESVISSSANTDKSKGKSMGNVCVPDSKREAIQVIADSLEPDVLIAISKNVDLVLDALESVLDKEPEAKVRQIIGYIGEQIYEMYLKEKRGVNYKNVADQGLGEYDFEITDENLFIDVKTNLYSLKDGNAPFYIHKSQNKFMQSHKDADFRIVRISLTDLDLVEQYRTIRQACGPDCDPRVNEDVRAACVKVAEKYWKRAKVETFESSSPEYSIRIE